MLGFQKILAVPDCSHSVSMDGYAALLDHFDFLFRIIGDLGLVVPNASRIL